MEDASSKKELEEEYTREIEIENAFKTFQEAIALQNEGKLAESYIKYKELSRKDVILNHYYEETSFMKGLQNGGLNTQTDELSFISQNVKTIRYHYFRNRGFLYFKILQSGGELIKTVLDSDTAISEPQTSAISEFDFTKELFYSMMDDLANCFVYHEVDELLLRLIFDLYVYMDIKKLARFTLEYAKSIDSESDDIMSLLPLNDWVDSLWSAFQKSGLTESSVSPSLSDRLSFLQPIKNDLQELILRRFERNTLEVPLKDSASWLEVIHSFNNALKTSQDKERVQESAKYGLKYLNPYLLTQAPIDRVQFVYSKGGDPHIIENDQMEIDQPEEPVTVVEEEEPKVEEVDSMDIKIETEEKPTDEESTPVPSTSLEKVVQRSSRRLKPEDAAPYEPDDIQLTRHYFVETEAFFNTINTHLAKVFEHDSPKLKDVVAYIVDQPNHETPQYIQDFVSALNDWDRKVYTPIVLSDKNAGAKSSSSKSDGEKIKLMDVLTRFGNQFTSDSSKAAEALDLQEGAELIKQKLADICTGGKNVNEVRIALIKHLIGDNDANMIVKFSWKRETYLAVREWVLQLEADIMNSWDHNLLTPDTVKQSLELTISIYEILIDLYIETKSEIDKYFESGFKGGRSKAGLSASSLELLRLDERISKWQQFLAQKIFKIVPESEVSKFNLPIITRYFWASNYRLAAKSFSWKEKKHAVENLQELAEFLKATPSGHTVVISLPNYRNLGDFSQESLHRRLSTASILSIFSKILYNDDPKNLDGSEDTIDLLESILIKTDMSDVSMDNSQSDVNMLVESVVNGKATLDKHSLSSVQDFLDECPIDLKLSLWNILFSYYEEIGSFTKFQKGFEQNLAFALGYWESLRYKTTKGDRSISFLKSLSFYKSYLKVFLKYLSENRWQLPVKDVDDDAEIILNLGRIFEICYTFSLHEESALITGNKISLGYRSEAAFKSFKDFFIDSVTILFVYYVNHIKNLNLETGEKSIHEILRLVHQQLGLRRLCDASEGLFLGFSEFTLVGFKEKPNVELAQLLSCRFHFKVKTCDQYPVDHYTTKVSGLDKSSATELAAFVLPLCFRDNPIIKAPRNDMKQVLDDLMEVIGDPDIEGNGSLVQNNDAIEAFIDTSTLTPRFIKDCFYGLTTIDFVDPQSDSRVALNGLYFLQAVTMFNSYKIRKKSAQSRTVELEKIIRLLKNDLMYGSERVESWLLLGQAYGYIVEDDLIWTSDKLNIIDRKVVTANLQRKSLVCYIMAVNTLTRKGLIESEDMNAVIGILMNSFVKELYGAVRVPMDMIAFKVRNTFKFVRKRNQTMFQTVTDKPTVPMKFCLKLMQKCLQLSIKANDKDWTSFYYFGKVMAKLDREPSQVVETLLTACELSKVQGTSADPLLEAPYKLVAVLYKYVHRDKLSVEAAEAYLRREPILNLPTDKVSTDKKLFYELCILALKKLISLDKKTWYHKPCYKISMIQYDEFDDYLKAREIMNKFFTLKAQNKMFPQMWKPEHERPGKHFVYNFQYTQFYIKLLRRELNLSLSIQILPRLRKANSTMVLLYFAWESLCASICKLIRVISQVDDNFVEVFMLKNSHNTFVTQARTVLDFVKEEGIREDQKPLFCYLQTVNDMRKLNNGFGPTSLIDDTLCSLFLKIFTSVADSHPLAFATPAEAAGAKYKKLAKRDLFPFINETVTKCKRDVDAILKDDPEVFNTYVSEYIEHKRMMSIQKLNPSVANVDSQANEPESSPAQSAKAVPQTANNEPQATPTAPFTEQGQKPEEPSIAKPVSETSHIQPSKTHDDMSIASPPPTIFLTRMGSGRSTTPSHSKNTNSAMGPSSSAAELAKSAPKVLNSKAGADKKPTGSLTTRQVTILEHKKAAGIPNTIAEPIVILDSENGLSDTEKKNSDGIETSGLKSDLIGSSESKLPNADAPVSQLSSALDVRKATADSSVAEQPKADESSLAAASSITEIPSQLGTTEQTLSIASSELKEAPGPASLEENDKAAIPSTSLTSEEFKVSQDLKTTNGEKNTELNELVSNEDKPSPLNKIEDTLPDVATTNGIDTIQEVENGGEKKEDGDHHQKILQVADKRKLDEESNEATPAPKLRKTRSQT